MDEILQKSPIFRGMDSQQINAFLMQVNYKVKTLKKDMILALAGETLKGLYIVLKGSVRGEMIDYSGKAITIENISSPMLLAPAFLFGNKATLPVDIIANEECEMFYLNKSAFVTAMQNEQHILSNYLDIISGRAQFLSQKIHFLSFKTIREKYLFFIINHKQKQGSDIFTIPNTQHQLAELFGVSRPALAKVIAELNEEGVLRTKGKQVEILKPSCLESPKKA